MNYKNLPDAILNYELMEYYDDDFNCMHDTIKDVLEQNGEDVEDADYKYVTTSNGVNISKLIIWTKTKVYTIVHDSWGDQLFGLPRNPPNQ